MATIGVLVALIGLTAALAAAFLVHPSFTAGATGKILAFVGLCVLPALCVDAGMSFHTQRSEQTSYCISCHTMASHGASLHLEDARFIPAQHYQNDLVPADKACYTCHTDYTIYGPWKSRLEGLKFIYMEYLGTPPKTIHLDGQYNNRQCLHCHEGTRDFEDHLRSMAPLAAMETNRVSCLSSGCHDMVHNAGQVGRLKMWNGLAATTPSGSQPASPASGGAAPGAGAKPTGAAQGTTGSASASRGEGLFESQGCGGCHGASGGGGVGPALAQIGSQDSAAQLTALLQAPTAQMKAAGMHPLTAPAADLKVLVAYVASLGGSAPAGPTEPSAPAGLTKAESQGRLIFQAHGCAGCHGTGGAGGTAAAPGLAGTGQALAPAAFIHMLRHPTTRMQLGGMPLQSLSSSEMRALAAYVSRISGASRASH